ncbi:hypothetical protein TWF694_003100 [Orbilia ellipsospora]|uniref:B30.2/SPRY domain-containing protein n=1 Tax=Orbilia ellipsospora TaxID=2528407 RepID=A0AAV9X0R4_9PEZI
MSSKRGSIALPNGSGHQAPEGFESSSPCWDKAQILFLSEMRKSRRFSEAATANFLQSGYRIDKTINSCLAMKNKADQEYGSNKRGGRFAGKLLGLLKTIKDVGDTFLEFAPESVSIAWSAVSILIKIGTDDLEKCEMISECCESIVTIVLNCRLYENRYVNATLERSEILAEFDQKIIDTIPNLLFLVLDFSWHTNYHLQSNRFLRSFKECFSNILREKIETLLSEYQKLRSIASDAFQEVVMQQLSSVEVKLGRQFDQLRADLFPAIQDLTLKIEAIEDKITTRFQEEDLRQKFAQKLEVFQTSEVYNKIFLSIFEPIRQNYKEMSLWLFGEPSYNAWEDPSNRNILLFCLKGPRGFGKSVKMTCIVKRLMEVVAVELSPVVLFFYFKRGDDATQYTNNCLKGLLSQLLHHNLFNEDIELVSQCLDVLEAVKKADFYGPGASSTGSIGSSNGAHDRTPEYITTLIKKVSELLIRPVYIVVDGVDECEDRIQGNLMHCLKELCRATGNIKAVCSTRDNINIESLLQDGIAGTTLVNKANDASDLPKDIATILVDERYNERDMKMYLVHKVEPIVLRRVGEKSGHNNFNNELERIVNIIQDKAKGNFTYAGMAVTNLQQPTKSTLETKLSQLPPAVEGLYRRSLEILTPDERELVVFALKWVIWSVDQVSIVEIIEHYKGIYIPKQEGYILPQGSSEFGPDGGTAKQLDTEDPYNPYSDPEIRETKYHLYNASRDFFQFDDATDSINVHLTVREWIQNEARVLDELETKAETPTLTRNQAGNWIVVLPIYALNNPTFQSRYVPWYPLGDSKYEDDINFLWHKNLESNSLAINSTTPGDPKTVKLATTITPTPEERSLEEESTKISRSPTESILSLTEPDVPREGSTLPSIEDVLETSVLHAEHATQPRNDSPDEKSSNNLDGLDGRNSDIVEEGYSMASESLDNPIVRKESRYETDNWERHLCFLQEEWLPEERVGKEWDEFWKQFKIFIEPQNWKKWGLRIRHLATRRIEDPKFLDRSFHRIFETPLHIAARYGLVFILDYVMKEKIASVEDLDRSHFLEPGLPIVHVACSQPNFLKAAIGYGANVETKNMFGETALGWSMNQLYATAVDQNSISWTSHVSSTEILLRARASTQCPQSSVSVPLLQIVVDMRNLQLFELILQKVDKAGFLTSDVEGCTVLHHLFGGRFIPRSEVQTDSVIRIYQDSGKAIFNMLCNFGADVNAQDHNSRGPLGYAAVNGDVEGLKWLLEKGADVHDDDHEGNTCLHMICLEEPLFKKLDLVAAAKVLIDAGLDPTRGNLHGITPLSLAVKKQKGELIGYLLRVHELQYPLDNSYLFQRDIHGRSLLYRCAARAEGGVEVAKSLIHKLTETEIEELLAFADSDVGFTALHIAADKSNLEMIDFLLDLNADVTNKTFSGKTVTDIALAKYLLKSARLSSQTPATRELLNRCERCLLRLLERTPEAALDSQTILHAAVRGQRSSLLHFLKQKSNPLKLDLPDEDGWTVYHTAIHSNAMDFLRLHAPEYPHDDFYGTLCKTKVPTRLSKDKVGRLGCLSDDGLETWHITKFDQPLGLWEKNFYLALADHPIPAEAHRYYFEMTMDKQSIDADGDGSIGLQTPLTKIYDGTLLGTENGVSFWDGLIHIPNGYLGYNTPYGPSDRQAGRKGRVDTVGCGFDTRSGLVFFTLNGEYLGIATKISTASRYYPAVAVHDNNCHFKLNFGQKPFIFDRAYEPLEVLGMEMGEQ